jgi:hypothetical protein
MGNVISLHAERWIEVFDESGVHVDVSTKGRVRFISESGDVAVLSMEQMARLGGVLTVAFTSEEGDNDEVKRDPAG